MRSSVRSRSAMMLRRARSTSSAVTPFLRTSSMICCTTGVTSSMVCPRASVTVICTQPPRPSATSEAETLLASCLSKTSAL